MRKLLLLLAIVTVMALPGIASAEVVTLQAPNFGANLGSGGPNQFSLNPYNQYTWRIDGVNTTGLTMTSATLTIHSVFNADNNSNPLFIHLLDSARFGPVSAFRDVPLSQVPVTSIADNFAGQFYAILPMVDPGTANTFLTQQVFPTTSNDFVYTFTADELNVLSAYFLNGSDIAFGFDPDGLFWNNGISFSFTTTTTPTPEPATLALLGTGLAGLYYRRRRQKRALASN